MCNLYRRAGHGIILAIIVAVSLFERCTAPPVAYAACQSFHVTGYTSTGNLTADGSSTYGNEWAIVAAHSSIPFDAILTIDGLGVFRVADRGWLGPHDIDILVNSAREAYDLTGEYIGCIAW